MNIINELGRVAHGMHVQLCSMLIRIYVSELELLDDETKLMILKLLVLILFLVLHVMIVNEDCIGDEAGCFPFFSIAYWSI